MIAWDRIRAWLTERREGVPMGRLFAAFLLIGLLSAWLGFRAVPASFAGRLVKHAGYYYIAGVFAWWVCACLALARSRGLGDPDWWRARLGRASRVALIWALLLSALAVLTVPRVYKVLFDEAVIQSTAWNLHSEREVATSNRVHEVEGELRTLETYLDKRPYFFAFIVSLLHDLTGYREGNAFALNTVLLPVVLLLVWMLARRIAGEDLALVALVSLGAFSLLAINANGSGLEMLNLALLLGLALAGAVYLRRPDETSLAVLVLTAVLLANTRYESAIYVGCAALIIVEGWRRADRLILPPVALFAPLLLIPYALHNRYLNANPRLWELREGMEARFSFEYLQVNLGYAWEYFTHVGPRIANSLWLTVGGIFAVGILAVRAWRRKPAWRELNPAVVSLMLCAIGVLGNLCLLMAYYWGDLSDPVVSRLSLPLHALLALAIAAAVASAPAAWRARAGSFAMLCAVVCYLAFGLRVNQYLGRLNGIEEASRWEERFVARRGPARRLIVTDKSPLLWFARGVPAIMPGRLIMKPDALPFHLAHHTFDEVLVTQTLVPGPAPGEYWLAPEHRLPDNYELETLGVHRVGTKLHRISLLKAIHPAPPGPAAPLPPDSTAPAEPTLAATSPLPDAAQS